MCLHPFSSLLIADCTVATCASHLLASQDYLAPRTETSRLTAHLPPRSRVPRTPQFTPTRKCVYSESENMAAMNHITATSKKRVYLVQMLHK